jgi:dUTP pyrophosphatase
MFPVKLLTITALMPTRATAGSAGLDLYADQDGYIPPGWRMAVSTGVSMAIPTGYEGQVRSRSGLAFKHGIQVLNAPGTIDSDYRDEVKVCLLNTDQHEGFKFWHGERIAQLVISKVEMLEPHETYELPNPGTRSGGFGSTGR